MFRMIRRPGCLPSDIPAYIVIPLSIRTPILVIVLFIPLPAASPALWSVRLFAIPVVGPVYYSDLVIPPSTIVCRFPVVVLSC